MSKMRVSAVVNGEPVEFLASPRQSLLDALRDELGLTGTKEGCGSGDCGACSVTVDSAISVLPAPGARAPRRKAGASRPSKAWRSTA